MFFQPGEYVIYGCKGVHRIMDRVMLAMDGSASEKEYYIMQPCEKPEGSVYAPVDAVKTNMRRIMTREEAEQLLRTAPTIQLLDFHNRNCSRRPARSASEAVIQRNLCALSAPCGCGSRNACDRARK